MNDKEDYAGLIEQLGEMVPKFWWEAEPQKLEPYFTQWMLELTAQALHDKADIATVLAILSKRGVEAASALTTLTQDAKRYQWLRDKGGARYQVTASQPEGYKPCITMRVPSLNESGTYQLMGNAADSAIDAAMEGKADE